jgi:hypothetical protein
MCQVLFADDTLPKPLWCSEYYNYGYGQNSAPYDEQCGDKISIPALMETVLGIMVSAFLEARSLAGCYLICCCQCSPEKAGKLRVAFLSPFVFVVVFSVLYSFSNEYHFDYYKAEDALGSSESGFGLAAMVVLIITWLLWAGMLTLNILTRFRWWPKQPHEPEPPAEEDTTCYGKFIVWPYIHWIAVGVWGLITLDVLIATGFVWFALRAILLIART